MKLFVGLMVGVGLWGQPNAPQVITLGASGPGAVTGVNATIVGNVGSDTLYYWVVPVFPIGQGQISSEMVVRNAPGVLSATRYVRVSWNRAAGASTYYLLRTTTPNIPTTCTCKVTGPSNITTFNDQGGALTSFTYNPTGVAVASILLDNINYAVPTLIATPSFGGGSGMVYPGAGVPNSTGIAWGASYAVGTALNNLVQLNGSAQLPAVSAALLTNFPTFNQNTTGTAAGLSATLVAGSGGTGVANTATLTLGSANQNWATLGTGIVKSTVTTGALSLAVASDVVSIFNSGTCSGYLKSDGTCDTPGGGGTVTSSGTPLIHQVPIWTTTTDLKGITVPSIDSLLYGTTSTDPLFKALPTGGTNGCSGTTDMLQWNNSSHAFACGTSTGGVGTVTVVSSGSLISTALATGGGTTTIQTPAATATMDASGNISTPGSMTAVSFIGNSVTDSGSTYFQGLTSGGVALAAADIAGTAITYVLPSTNGAAGQVLSDSGTTTCPTLLAGTPATCHLMVWIAPSGGTNPSCTLATLGAVIPTAGDQCYCSDCTVTSGIDNTCVGSGSGAMAFKIGSVAKCVQ
jgi:hypothetical protein